MQQRYDKARFPGGKVEMGRSRPCHHADEVLTAISTDAAARSALVASWRRSSALHGLTPDDRRPPRRLSASELRLARERLEPLIRVAGASLDKLYQAVGGAGCCVLLADSDGVPLERRGAPADDATFESWGLWPGTDWSEESEGTNAIGTALVEKRAVTIYRDQHFFSRNTLLGCITAPIYDHEGRVAGALDVSSCRSDLTEAFARLIAVAVGDAARRIEAETFRQAYAPARILLSPGSNAASEALVAVDADDLVIGATRAARAALGLAPGALRPQPARDLLATGDRPAEDLAAAERGVLQRALARADGNVTAAARDLGISRATLHRKLARSGLRRPI